MFLRPSVQISIRLSAWNNSALTGRIFMIINILVFVSKIFLKNQVSLKSDKNNRNFHDDQ